MTESEIKKAVLFVIYMENNQGILEKAPSYLEEKWELCMNHPTIAEAGLDSKNIKKYKEWKNVWMGEE